jgi:hypothetical protein
MGREARRSVQRFQKSGDPKRERANRRVAGIGECVGQGREHERYVTRIPPYPARDERVVSAFRFATELVAWAATPLRCGPQSSEGHPPRGNRKPQTLGIRRELGL